MLTAISIGYSIYSSPLCKAFIKRESFLLESYSLDAGYEFGDLASDVSA